MTAMEDVALWHERDISHSSAERVLLPDASIALDFMIERMNRILTGLVVYPENMKKNLEKTQDVIFSGALLLALVDKGLSREKAYELIQRAAFAARNLGTSLQSAVAADKEITNYLSEGEIRKTFDLNSHFKNVPFIFRRVF